MFKRLNVLSRTEMKLLEFISRKDGELYERQIAEEAGVSVGSANSILKAFEKLGLVKKARKGNMLFYRRTDENPLLRQFKVFMTVNNLSEAIGKLAQYGKRIVLFGSCAEGRNTEKSDIDLFILSGEREEIRRIIDDYPEIQAIILDSMEYAKLEEKDKPLYERINAGIELYGENDG
ncbi:Nucleotidyltransferase domain protein [uncultured archaeon]|nr:Nucleotidyltransferase domain protein [uncultured archaeon]